jgi:hypothetical protein
MLEHFGVHMYKRREVAIAELVSNSWDAGATRVEVCLPDSSAYDKRLSEIVVRDNGCGMKFEDVRDCFLVLGRNRRKISGLEIQMFMPFDTEYDPGIDSAHKARLVKRRVMGRKGIGKLAGFGVARVMAFESWTNEGGIRFTLDIDRLKRDDNTFQEIEIQWEATAPRTDFSPTGTMITLAKLKHGTSVDIDKLTMSLSRRFSRTVRGEMHIKVNGADLPDPTPGLIFRHPAEGYDVHEFGKKTVAKYWYGFSKETIKNRELWGFSVLVNGKIAQAPPFFFDAEATASGQHATRYLIGEIEADFIDASIEDDDDLISTDRQELDWDDERLKCFLEWGKALTRDALRECTNFRGELTARELVADGQIEGRICKLDTHSASQVRSFIRILGNADVEKEHSRNLVDTLLRAYEYRQFHDLISDIQAASSSPDRLAEILHRLGEWKVLESRALLEVIKGRLDILDKFENMLCNNSPETASSRSPENLHDLLAGNPWLLNPEWQVLAEEKTITKQLREWGAEEVPEFHGRYDFLALGTDGLLVIIEIKRADYPAELEEMQRLVTYQDKLSLAHGQPIKMVFICGREPKISRVSLETFKSNAHYEIRHWHQLFSKTKSLYEHYRDLLEGSVDNPGFAAKEREIVRTRELLAHGVHRDSKARAAGIPSQDVELRIPPQEGV